MFLVVTIDNGGERAVHAVLPELAGLTRSVGFRYPERELTLLTGIGSDAWDRLFAGPRPAGLHPFRAVNGERHTAPSTPGDLLFHIRADTADLCFELAARILEALEGAVTVVDAVNGFRYFDTRDLLGFVDGTENPTGAEADRATTIGDDDPRFADGAYVHIQKYLHDLAAWKALTVEEQEAVIGRRKLEDTELPDEQLPADAHIRLNAIEDEAGRELEVVRLNMPFGDLGRGEFGTFYIAYSRDPGITERMLDNMFIGDPPGTTDAILEFSTAHTGCLFFVAPGALLDDPPPAARVIPEPAPAVTAPPAAPAGQLRIGSLKGQN
ncbi:Dyp-type peroxidase [Tessaracoccus sp. HDW20]|nr:Dyp-type peroxidase [Tessaracoccus coleopterorum]NHB84111.1 Dyp-type peroxidase [Tessaracoccus coleopterorum]